MIGELTSRQILALSSEGLDSASIAAQLQLEEPFVKLVLARNDSGSAEDRDINNEQLAILRNGAFDLATRAEDESVRARMTMFLIERDKPRLAKEVSNNITQINQAIVLAQKGFDDMVKQYSK